MNFEKNYNDYVYLYKPNLPISQIKETCLFAKDLILQNTNSQDEGIPLGTATTRVFNQYNMLLFPFPGMYELYEAMYNISLNHIDTSETNWYMQAWMNYYEKDDYIDWHQHFISTPNSWHGFYCVDCRDSVTSYKFPDGNSAEIPSTDGNLVIGISNGDKHRTWPWKYDDGPRITIAFDVVPEDQINFGVNHWIPLLKRKQNEN